MKKLFAALMMSAMAAAASADTLQTMTLEAFMEDYAKPAAKLAKAGNEQPMIRVLAAIPDMAVDKDKKEWDGIIDKAVSMGKASASCRACHTKFKKAYQRNHKNLEVAVSAELLNYLQQQ